MHVAHFTNTYYPVVSGVVRSVATFRQALTELGHNVFILAQQSNDYKDNEPFVFRYPSVDLPLMSGFPLTIPISNFIDQVLPTLKIDVIHSHHPFLLGQTAATKAHELDVPLVFTFHTRYREYSHYVSLSQEFVKDTISRWLGEYMQQCHHVVVPSESIKQMLTEDYGILEQVSVVPTGIDLRPYRQATGHRVRETQGWGQDKVLISIGRLAKEKNWAMLLEAVAEVMRHRSDVRLVIIGDGDDRVELQDIAIDLDMRDRVEFTGKIPFADIPEYLSAADLFCFASTTETQGLVTMEAMAAGLPVVAVEASGTRDVVENDKEGFLTLNQSDSLARAIERIVRDDNLRHRFSQAALKNAETFEMKRMGELMVAVYEQALVDHEAKRFVPVDTEKKVFTVLDEEQWSTFLGLNS
jgi:glycosyltransferase involved in cell wall biosynthesis